MIANVFDEKLSKLDHYIIFHLSQSFQSGKIGEISFEGYFSGMA